MTIFETNTPSPAMAAAFALFADAVAASFAGGDGSDEQATALGDVQTKAVAALLALHIAAPADFMVKVAAGLIDGDLAEFRNYGVGRESGEPCRWHEMPWDDDYYIGNKTTAQVALYRDLIATDLGRCIFALGRVDFDAEAWLEAAARAKVAVGVVVANDEPPQPVVIQPVGHLDAFEQGRVDAVIGLIREPAFAKERRAMILDRIAEAHPDRVLREPTAA